MANNLFASLPLEAQPKEPPKNEKVPEALRGKTVDEVWDQIESEATRLAEEAEARGKAFSAGQASGGQPSPQQQPPVRQQQPPFRPSPPQGFSPQGFQQPPEEEENFLLNPEGYLDKALTRRVGPIVEQNARAMRAQNSMIFQQRDPEFYKRFGSEMEQFIDNLALPTQADPKSYEVAKQIVISQHFEELAEERAKAKMEEYMKNPAGFQQAGVQQVVQPQRQGFFGGTVRQAPVSEKPTSTGQSTTKKVELTQAQKRMAEEFGMTEAEYLEYAVQNTDMKSMLARGEEE